MRDAGVLINRTGPRGDVLKIRPPLVFASEHVESLIPAFAAALADSGRLEGHESELAGVERQLGTGESDVTLKEARDAGTRKTHLHGDEPRELRRSREAVIAKNERRGRIATSRPAAKASFGRRPASGSRGALLGSVSQPSACIAVKQERDAACKAGEEP